LQNFYPYTLLKSSAGKRMKRENLPDVSVKFSPSTTDEKWENFATRTT